MGPARVKTWPTATQTQYFIRYAVGLANDNCETTARLCLIFRYLARRSGFHTASGNTRRFAAPRAPTAWRPPEPIPTGIAKGRDGTWAAVAVNTGEWLHRKFSHDLLRF